MGRKLGGSCAPLGEGGRTLDPHLTQCDQRRGLPVYQVSSGSVQPFGHNTPTLQTGQTDNGPIAYGEPFCKRLAQKFVIVKLTSFLFHFQLFSSLGFFRTFRLKTGVQDV